MGTETMSFAVLSENSYRNILFARSACEKMPSKDGQPMIELKEVSHNESEDYEITWADSALEQIMRLYLEKPEAPILHSDVWDIQAVYLRNPYRFFSDTESASADYYVGGFQAF